MPSLIKSIDKIDIDQWWSIAQADKNATFYQTPAWLEVANCMSAEYENASFMGELASGTKFVFPLCTRKHTWPTKQIFSVYDQCYGGVISDRPISTEEHKAIVDQLPLSPFTSFDLTEVPGTANSNPFSDTDKFWINEYTSSELSLTGKSPDDIYRGFRKSRREDYRKGVKAGLHFRRADPNRITEEFDRFYEIYLETSTRWGDDVVGDLLTRDFLKKLEVVVQKYPQHFFLWFAELDGKAISTATAFGWHNRLDGWVMSSRPEYFKIKPAVFILANILKWAAENEYSLFHFGPNGAEQGLIDFKRRFGAEQVPYKTWHRSSPVLSLMHKLRIG